MSHEWGKPGADIGVYVDNRDGAHRLQRYKVRTVAAKSFTVGGIEARFQVATMSTKESGGYWGWKYVAVHPDSETATEVADRDSRDGKRSKARQFLSSYSVDDLAKVDEAIQVLREWRAVLVQGGVS